VGGALTSTASTQFRIEFFVNVTADPTGYGEGQRYLGAYTVTTNAGGVTPFNTTLTATVATTETVTATATDPNGNTSEFGPNVSVTIPLVVNNTGNAGDNNIGDGVCLTAGGVCTLRAAIQEANALAGANTINFSIAGAGPHTITPGSTLPDITGAVVIDGWTEPDYATAGTPQIVLNGSLAGASADGLTLTSGASGSTIRGLVIRDFGATGLYLYQSNNNLIVGNYVGVDATGLAAAGNNNGLYAEGADGNLIGGATAQLRNVFAGNDTWSGVEFDLGSDNNVLIGNYIGVGANGTTPVGNAEYGVWINASSNNRIGGTAVGQGNLIRANGLSGVGIEGASLGNAVQGNAIYGNAQLGIDLAANGLVAPNDGAKSAGQPNLLMDYPVFTSAVISGTTLTVSGYIGTAPGDPDFANTRVEVFESDNDGSGFGEGMSYLGALTTTTSGDFSGMLTVSGVVAGDRVTGTATDASNNTSEFGPNFAVTYPFVTREPTASTDCVQVDYASGTVAWASTGNAYRTDNAYAQVSVDGTTSEYLYCRNFGFALPAGATIQGIVIDVERKSNSTSNGGSRDASVRLVNAGGAVVGNDNATTTLYTTSDLVEAHGSSGNLWGVSWTVADINDADFGVVLAVTKPSSVGAAHSITVDHIRITVYYSP
jgi:hypothetical protein